MAGYKLPVTLGGFAVRVNSIASFRAAADLVESIQPHNRKHERSPS
jgi:hypothetical protein